MSTSTKEEKIKMVKALVQKGLEAHEEELYNKHLEDSLFYKGLSWDIETPAKPAGTTDEITHNAETSWKSIPQSHEWIVSSSKAYDQYNTIYDKTAQSLYKKKQELFVKKGAYKIQPQDPPPTYIGPTVIGNSSITKAYVEGILSDEHSLPAEPSYWFYKDAKAFINKLQKWARDYNYHVCLGGSVLNKGLSKKDLDLYFLPLNNGNTNQPYKLLHDLQLLLQASLAPLGSEYPDKMAPYIFKGKLVLEDTKRIDFFMLGTMEEGTLLAEDKTFMIESEKLDKQTVDIEPTNFVHYKKSPK